MSLQNKAQKIAQYQAFIDAVKKRPRPVEIPMGLDWLVVQAENLLQPRPSGGKLMAQASKVLDLQEHFRAMPEQPFREQLLQYRDMFFLGRETPKDIIEALGCVREAAWRVRRELPHQTQVAGAMGIFQRCIVEMATGEGKTLTAALAAVIGGWRGKGCHVLTSNDYLAERDAETMAEFYEYCGLSVGSVTQAVKPDARPAAYWKDITYTTSKDATADFLRDQLALGEQHSVSKALAGVLSGTELPSLMQRGLACAIIDEADSVLCDGGSTPLIISGQGGTTQNVHFYQWASDAANGFELGQDFLVNPAFREARLTTSGKAKATELAQKYADQGMSKHRMQELLVQALEARQFFQASVQYVVHEGKVVLVDEPTGRIMPDHEWRDGMHQAVSAKEGLEISPPRVTNTQSSFQDFFLRYSTLGGMTGTGWEARKEFRQFYDLSVVRIPTHKPCLRKEVLRHVSATEEEKIMAVVEEIQRVHTLGCPVLVGTRSIEISELVSAAMTKAGLAHEVLNALNHAREAEIIASAGHVGALTVATNMAGRGTDIKLSKQAFELGGLHVILTERYASARVDRQLRGRCARQGDPGSTADMVSLEDPLFKNVPKLLLKFLAVGLKRPAWQRLASWSVWKLIDVLQWHGDRSAFQQRKNMVKSSREFSDMASYTGRQL